MVEKLHTQMERLQASGAMPKRAVPPAIADGYITRKARATVSTDDERAYWGRIDAEHFAPADAETVLTYSDSITDPLWSSHAKAMPVLESKATATFTAGTEISLDEAHQKET